MGLDEMLRGDDPGRRVYFDIFPDGDADDLLHICMVTW